jgi:diguanylate cyclase (GGDEF)-like protein/PAS domain S-box-containing protein
MNPLPMILYDRDSFALIKVNQAALAHYGFATERFLGLRLYDLHPEEEWSALEENRTYAPPGAAHDHVWRHILADGRLIDVQIFAREQTLHGSTAVLAAIIDVTEQRATQLRIAHFAHHDPLTDLANRTLLRQRVDHELARLEGHASRLALLWLDLDHFKQVNDGLGHPAGDRLLCLAGERLRGALGAGDITARIGGDEFAILLVDPSGPEKVNEIADLLVDRMNAPYEIDGHDVICGCSIGIALAPNDGVNAEDLFKKADIALYRAKREGRGSHRFFQPEMDQQIEMHRAMVADLRMAVAAHDFTLVYQPIVELEGSRIVSCEALLRWRHPFRGDISPQEFIPLVEESGLIAQLGDWVLKTACADAAKWPGHIGVAVNLSPVQFKNPHLVQSVVLALAQSGLSSHRLELEVTESVLLHDSEANLATLHTLRNIGVKISMDDFGTGYSSLSYLRAFPFDKIKLDQSFVKDLPDGVESLAIVRAISIIGMSLGLTILAEGVETVEQMRTLCAEGFAQAQGYLFARPQPAEDIPGLIRTGVCAGTDRNIVFAGDTRAGP